MGDVTYPRVDGVVFIHGAFQMGDSIYLPRIGAKTILRYRGWTFRRVRFRRRSPGDRRELRYLFDSSARPSYLKMLGSTRRDSLLAAGLTLSEVNLMVRGIVPQKYEVHHILPLDDGGTNAFDNLVLIRSKCEHSALTAYQNAFARGMAPGDEVEIDYPVPSMESAFAVYPPSADDPEELMLWPKRRSS
jgi:hypothetical protein